MQNPEEFDPTAQMEEPVNSFKIVHIQNKSSKYHLTRQVLINSVLSHNTYSFFYHILSKSTDEFNQVYGSFACIMPRSDYESDLYLNVDSLALKHLIDYVQTGKINFADIHSNNPENTNEIIDLATMFGMPDIVTAFRKFILSDEAIEHHYKLVETLSTSFLQLCQAYMSIDNETVQRNEKLLKAFFNDNSAQIKLYMKKHCSKANFSPTTISFCVLLFKIFVFPYLEKIFGIKFSGDGFDFTSNFTSNFCSSPVEDEIVKEYVKSCTKSTPKTEKMYHNPANNTCTYNSDAESINHNLDGAEYVIEEEFEIEHPYSECIFNPQSKFFTKNPSQKSGFDL